MYKQSAYLYKNIQYLYTDLVASTTGYRKMYARPMKLYKGMDNTFELRLLNGDQKTLEVDGYTVFWQILDRDTAELKYITSVEVTPQDMGRVTMSVPAGDIETIPNGLYVYSSYMLSPTGVKTILYGDSQYGATVTVEIIGNAFPQVLPSTEITEFVVSGQVVGSNPDTLYTSAINARPQLSMNGSTHTAAIYSTGFNGTVDIEATLENGVGAIVNWSVIETITLSDADTIVYKNFQGVFTWIRFHVKPNIGNSGTVDKILYRS
jgi:hypothetical protein